MKIVIALGGNALLKAGQAPTYGNQYANIRTAVKQIADVARSPSTKLLITHGNGPQVGEEMLRNEYAKAELPELPMHILNAETQASIGSMVVTALSNEFAERGMKRTAAAVLTHTVVDGNDSAFSRPTKPVGPFYTHAQLKAELKHRRFSYVEERDMFRRVVPSPEPISVIEMAVIGRMVDAGVVVVAGGGGGIPVCRKSGAYSGVEAVIDKDRTAQLMASSLHAEKMAILTDVDCLYANYPDRRSAIRSIGARELERMLPMLEEGTMRPKAEACVAFAERGGRRAYIGSLSEAKMVLDGRAGTTVTGVGFVHNHNKP